MTASFRIFFFGNMGCISYRTASFLRQRGIDCVVVHPEGRKYQVRNDPAMVDPTFSDEDMPWFQRLRGKPDATFFREAERDFDLVFVSGKRAIQLAHGFDETAVPVVVHTTGPQNVPDSENLNEDDEMALKTLQKSSTILTGHTETYARIEALGFADKIRFQLPLLDVKNVKAMVNQTLLSDLEVQYQKYDRVFAWLSRNLTDPNDPCYKGTEHFILAVSGYLRRHPDANVRIVLGNHGPQAEDVLSLVQSEGLHERIDMVGHLDYPDVAAYLSLRKLVLFDNLAQGTVSSGIFRDSMSLGTVLVRHMDAKDTALVYGRACPVIDAWDTESCIAAMQDIYALTSQEMAARQDAILAWSHKTLHWEARVDAYIEMLREPILRKRLRASTSA